MVFEIYNNFGKMKEKYLFYLLLFLNPFSKFLLTSLSLKGFAF